MHKTLMGLMTALLLSTAACAPGAQTADAAGGSASAAESDPAKAGYRFLRLAQIGDLKFDFYDGKSPAKVPAWVNVVIEQPARPTEDPLSIDRIVIKRADAARGRELLALIQKNAHETDATCSFVLGPVFDVSGFEGGSEVHRVCTGTYDALTAKLADGISCTGEDLGPGDEPPGAYVAVELDGDASTLVRRELSPAKPLVLVAAGNVIGLPMTALGETPGRLEFWAGDSGAAGAETYRVLTGKTTAACTAP